MAKAVWTDWQRAEVSRRRKLRRLYEGDHQTYFVLPNGEERPYEYVTVNWLGDLLSQTWKRLLFRQFPSISGQTSAQKAATERLESLLDLPGISLPAALQTSWSGRAVLKCYWSQLSQAPVLELWEKSDSEAVFFEYLPTDRSRPVAVNFWYSLQSPDREGNQKTYWVRERHELLAGEGGAVSGVRLTNTAYKAEGREPVDETVPLADIWPGEEPPPEETVTPGLTMLPCVVVQNVDRNGDRTGDTDYTPSLVSLQKNLNKLVASRQFVIDTSEEPNFQIPQEYLDENGEVDWRRVKIRVRYQGDASEPIDISGWTGNLENSSAQWQFYRQEFRSLTGIAPALFGETEGTGGESGYARRLGMVPTEAEVGARRRSWERAFRDALGLAALFMRLYGGEQLDVGEVAITWPQAIPEDSTEVSQTTTQEYREGARSLASVVARLNPEMTEEQQAAEVARIESEQQAKRALAVPDLSNPYGGQ